MNTSSAPPYGPAREGLSLLALLTFLNVLNFVDRQLIAALAPLLIAELGLTRAQIGLLTGFAFVLVYTVAGVFLGALADRVSRPRLIAAGLVCWSLATTLTGAATRFSQFVLARMVVGIGEATLTPAALSMLAEVLPTAWLGRAAGIYYAGVPVGAGLSLIVSGMLAPRYGWQFCFVFLGLAGLVFTLVLLLVPDPRSRTRSAEARAAAANRPAPPSGARRDAPPFRTLFAEMLATLRSVPALGLAITGGVLVTFTAASANHLLTWLVEERGFAFQRGAYLAGGIHATAGLCGNLFGGWFADWCAGRWAGGRLWSIVITVVVFSPFGLAFMALPPDSPLFHLSWFMTALGSTTWYGPLFAVAQDLAPARIRSTSIAFLMLALNVLGVGLGPWVTGIIGDARSLTTGLLASVGVGACSVVPFSIAARRYARDRARL